MNMFESTIKGYYKQLIIDILEDTFDKKYNYFNDFDYEQIIYNILDNGDIENIIVNEIEDYIEFKKECENY